MIPTHGPRRRARQVKPSTDRPADHPTWPLVKRVQQACPARIGAAGESWAAGLRVKAGVVGAMGSSLTERQAHARDATAGTAATTRTGRRPGKPVSRGRSGRTHSMAKSAIVAGASAPYAQEGKVGQGQGLGDGEAGQGRQHARHGPRLSSDRAPAARAAPGAVSSSGQASSGAAVGATA